MKLTGQEQKRLAKNYTENTEAYQLYLKGRYFWNKRTVEGFKKAVEYFRQATDSDPNYAPAYAGLADCYDLMSDYDVIPSKEAFPRAEEASQKALKIDDSLAEAHTSLAYARYRYDWDWGGAEEEFKRAIALNPNYATAHHWYGEYLAMMGRFDDSLTEIRRAAELDPLSSIINADEGWFLYLARRPDEAIKQLRKTLEMDQNFAEAYFYLGEAYEQKGMFVEAIANFQRAKDLNVGDGPGVLGLGHAYALSGRRGEAQQVIADFKNGSKGEEAAAPPSQSSMLGLTKKIRRSPGSTRLMKVTTTA